MIAVENKFEKGEKAFVITNLGGVFKLLEVTVNGIVYQDFEEGEDPVFFYTYDLAPDEAAAIKGAKAGNKVFAKVDEIFKTAEEAIKAVKAVLAVNVENFDENIKAMESQLVTIKEMKEKLIASAQDLTLSKLL